MAATVLAGVLLLLSAAHAFVLPPSHNAVGTASAMPALNVASHLDSKGNAPRLDPTATTPRPLLEKLTQVTTTVAVAVVTSPLVALAEEAVNGDEYEYGAVNAPIGVAWAVGCLAILTALLPIALQGGEEAFEEMRKEDEGVWGTGKTSALDRKRGRKR